MMSWADRSWTGADGGSAPISVDTFSVALTLDDREVFAGVIDPFAQLVSIHGTTRVGSGRTHELTVRVTTSDGRPYEPRRAGGGVTLAARRRAAPHCRSRRSSGPWRLAENAPE